MILKSLKYYAGSLSKLNLPFPFEYTFNPSQFQYKDARFEEFPAAQKLFAPEKQHIEYVFKLFEQLLNKGLVEKATSQYIDERLISKTQQLKRILKQSETDMEVKIDHTSYNQTAGYLEYFGYSPTLFMHQYLVNKAEDKLLLVEKQELKKAITKSGEELLQQDMQEMNKQNQLGEKIKETLFKKKKYNTSKVLLDIAEAFQHSYQNSLKQKKFKQYVLVNKINAKMDVNLSSGASSGSPEQLTPGLALMTKWCYEVNSEQPESVRRSRKRKLFDVQLWSRGSLIPIKDFSSS